MFLDVFFCLAGLIGHEWVVSKTVPHPTEETHIEPAPQSCQSSIFIPFQIYYAYHTRSHAYEKYSCHLATPNSGNTINCAVNWQPQTPVPTGCQTETMA